VGTPASPIRATISKEKMGEKDSSSEEGWFIPVSERGAGKSLREGDAWQEGEWTHVSLRKEKTERSLHYKKTLGTSEF